jgi:RimJ/RimL family protein N-acetyltransferase
VDAPFNPEPAVLEGQIVRLEPIELRHAPDLLEAAQDPSIWTYLLMPQPKSVADVEEHIRASLQWVERGSRIVFAAIERASGKAVGVTCYYDIDRPNRWLEIGGTWYDVRVQRTALNTECKLLLLRHAFENLGAVRVQLKTDVLNERSRTAIERIGGKFEGSLRNYQTYWHGRVRDTALYSIVAGEWPEVKVNLERRLAAPAPNA